VTTLTEKRSAGDTIAGFLFLVALLVAWRAYDAAPIASVFAGAFALLTLVGWVRWRRQPRSELKIGPDAITWAGPAREVTRIERGPTGALRLLQSPTQQAGWSLIAADHPSAGISLIGFDLDQVRAACVQHGWRFE
jgi:hypothetical protein